MGETELKQGGHASGEYNVDHNNVRGVYSKAFQGWQKDNPFVKGRYEVGTDWIGDEYEKHIKGVRDRYPLLTSLLLRGTPKSNANLSTIGDTNKYARLADAYNAKYIYKPSSSIGYTVDNLGGGSISSDSGWTPINKIETQDMKQMEQFRAAQGDLRRYGLEQESHFQQDYWKRKADEMQKLVDQEYTEQFFNSNEEMRRTKELFDQWGRMNERDFEVFLDKIKMPREQALEVKRRIAQGDYMGAMFIYERMGGTPMQAEQYIAYEASSPMVRGYLAGEIGDEAIYQALGVLRGQQLIGQFSGLINSARNYGSDPSGNVKRLATLVDTGVKELSELGTDVAKNAKLIAAIMGGFVALKGVLGLTGQVAGAMTGVGQAIGAFGGL